MSTPATRPIRSLATPATKDEIQGRGRSIGAILIDAGHLTPQAAEQIVHEQKSKKLKFGEAGVMLGLLEQKHIDFALSRQFHYSYLLPDDGSVSEELVAAFRPFSPAVEQLRALRSQLMLRWFDREPERRALAVVSPDRGEGRTFIAANLSIVFSQLGERTLVIDADLRKPRQHRLFNLANHFGLSNVLSGRAGSEAIARVGALSDLSVLPAGTPAPNPQELLARAQFTGLLEQVTAEYDIVIVDTPAASAAADAYIAAKRAGAAVLVAQQDRTSAPGLQMLAGTLTESRTAVVGAVLNAF
jgi:protein-tyrosine kinase